MTTPPLAKTSPHNHAHSHGAHAHRNDHDTLATARFSALNLSGGDRLKWVSGVVALLWAGVFWALH